MSLDPVKWKKEYSTGNESVDFQHQYFAQLINRISGNLMENDDVEIRKKLLDESTIVKVDRKNRQNKRNC